MSQNDTGESTRSINARGDDLAWPAVQKALEKGAELRRPSGLRRYYPYSKDVPTGHGTQRAMSLVPATLVVPAGQGTSVERASDIAGIA